MKSNSNAIKKSICIFTLMVFCSLTIKPAWALGPRVETRLANEAVAARITVNRQGPNALVITPPVATFDWDTATAEGASGARRSPLGLIVSRFSFDWISPVFQLDHRTVASYVGPMIGAAGMLLKGFDLILWNPVDWQSIFFTVISFFLVGLVLVSFFWLIGLFSLLMGFHLFARPFEKMTELIWRERGEWQADDSRIIQERSGPEKEKSLESRGAPSAPVKVLSLWQGSEKTHISYLLGSLIDGLIQSNNEEELVKAKVEERVAARFAIDVPFEASRDLVMTRWCYYDATLLKKFLEKKRQKNEKAAEVVNIVRKLLWERAGVKQVMARAMPEYIQEEVEDWLLTWFGQEWELSLSYGGKRLLGQSSRAFIEKAILAKADMGVIFDLLWFVIRSGGREYRIEDYDGNYQEGLLRLSGKNGVRRSEVVDIIGKLNESYEESASNLWQYLLAKRSVKKPATAYYFGRDYHEGSHYLEKVETESLILKIGSLPKDRLHGASVMNIFIKGAIPVDGPTETLAYGEYNIPILTMVFRIEGDVIYVLLLQDWIHSESNRISPRLKDKIGSLEVKAIQFMRKYAVERNARSIKWPAGEQLWRPRNHGGPVFECSRNTIQRLTRRIVGNARVELVVDRESRFWWEEEISEQPDRQARFVEDTLLLAA